MVTKPPKLWATMMGGSSTSNMPAAWQTASCSSTKQVHRIILAPVRIAHARQVHRGDVVIAGEERGDERPPIGMRRIAVDQQQAGTCAVAPAQIMNARAIHFDETAFGLDGDGAVEPARAGRNGARQRRERTFRRHEQLRERTLRLGHRGQRRSGRGPSVLKMPVPVMIVRSPHQIRPSTVKRSSFSPTNFGGTLDPVAQFGRRDEISEQPHRHPIMIVSSHRHGVAERGVREGHQHAAVAIHHAVGVMLADEKGARVAAVGLLALIERTDLAAETARPAHLGIARRDAAVRRRREDRRSCGRSAPPL